MNCSREGRRFRAIDTASRCPSSTLTRWHCALILKSANTIFPSLNFAENLARFGFNFFFLVRDVRNDIVDDVEAGNPRVSGTRERLHRDDVNLLDSKSRLQRRQRQDQRHRRTIGIRNDVPVLVILILLLNRNQRRDVRD